METTLLPIALGLVMLGLGLSLTTDDFARVARHPKAVAIALVCQILVLPVICFGLVQLFGLPPVLAVGMMLLAASPGGTTAAAMHVLEEKGFRAVVEDAVRAAAIRARELGSGT